MSAIRDAANRAANNPSGCALVSYGLLRQSAELELRVRALESALLEASGGWTPTDPLATAALCPRCGGNPYVDYCTDPACPEDNA